MPSELFETVSHIYTTDQDVGLLKGYNKACGLIIENAKFGITEIDQSDISPEAIIKLKGEGFQFKNNTRSECDDDSAYEVDVWRITWK
jgi:hypothetical protein